MNQEAHVAALTQKHAALEEVIAEENQRPNPDSLKLTELKRQKLRLKDELQQLVHS